MLRHQHVERRRGRSVRPRARRAPPRRRDAITVCMPHAPRSAVMSRRFVALSSTTSARRPSNDPSRRSAVGVMSVRSGLERHVERAALAGDARCSSAVTRPAHQLGEAPADREPEPRAAVPAGGRRVDLAERLEEPAHPVGRDADAGVADVDVIDRRVSGARSRLAAGRDHDLAALGELDGVGQQVEHDLAEAARVADGRLGRPRLDVVGELEALAPPRPGRSGRRPPRCTLAQVERRALELHPPGLDLREVEDVVDDREQRLAAASRSSSA